MNHSILMVLLTFQTVRRLGGVHLDGIRDIQWIIVLFSEARQILWFLFKKFISLLSLKLCLVKSCFVALVFSSIGLTLLSTSGKFLAEAEASRLYSRVDYFFLLHSALKKKKMKVNCKIANSRLPIKIYTEKRVNKFLREPETWTCVHSKQKLQKSEKCIKKLSKRWTRN